MLVKNGLLVGVIVGAGVALGVGELIHRQPPAVGNQPAQKAEGLEKTNTEPPKTGGMFDDGSGMSFLSSSKKDKSNEIEDLENRLRDANQGRQDLQKKVQKASKWLNVYKHFPKSEEVGTWIKYKGHNLKMKEARQMATGTFKDTQTSTVGMQGGFIVPTFVQDGKTMYRALMAGTGLDLLIL